MLIFNKLNIYYNNNGTRKYKKKIYLDSIKKLDLLDISFLKKENYIDSLPFIINNLSIENLECLHLYDFNIEIKNEQITFINKKDNSLIMNNNIDKNIYKRWIKKEKMLDKLSKIPLNKIENINKSISDKNNQYINLYIESLIVKIKCVLLEDEKIYNNELFEKILFLLNNDLMNENIPYLKEILKNKELFDNIITILKNKYITISNISKYILNNSNYSKDKTKYDNYIENITNKILKLDFNKLFILQKNTENIPYNINIEKLNDDINVFIEKLENENSIARLKKLVLYKNENENEINSIETLLKKFR